MTLVELTRILPENRKVKWSINPSNVVYIQEPIEDKIGCTLVDVTGRDVDVVESYQDVLDDKRCAKSFILLVYDILARHTTASRALHGFKDFDVTAFAQNFDGDA